GHSVCALAYEILSRADHPYSRLLVDIAQGQIWIEKGELDRAEALMRKSVQQCVMHNVPTMLAPCTGIFGNALARNGKASEAVPLLEKGFSDRILDASGPYGRTFMRVALGVAYRNFGRLDDAIRAGRKAVEQAGEEYGHRTEALYELAETLRCAGDEPAAEACFAQTSEAARRLGMPYYQKRAVAALAKRQEDWHPA
ncbi:tetratricopeptide repeat protein, partial [Bradyrhizobium sp. UFLA05-153]